MENNTIKCPFCLKESQRGVRVCTGCQASVLYGTFLIGMATGMAGATISLPLIFAVGYVAGKAIFSENIIFRRRM